MIIKYNFKKFNYKLIIKLIIYLINYQLILLDKIVNH